MGDPSTICRDVETALQPGGILIRGTVDFAPGEGPLMAGGGHAASVVLLGNAGGSIWPAFSRWKANHHGPHPLDTWSRLLIEPVADALGGTAYFPSDQPWQPFQQWAMRAEGLKPSPLGILIHPRYGLWHGYRGAIGFPFAIGSKSPVVDSACDRCETKPCLTACPASAITPDPSGFHLQRCRTFLATEAGQAGCMTSGCLARAACPVGAGYRYSAEQLRFHMQALDIGPSARGA